MPITVVGRVSKFAGKSVFELVSNVKDFGVGRIVYRSAFLRYEEPTYWRLTRVEPEMDQERKLGSAWGEAIWRGKNYGVHQMLSPYKADYRLLPKDEEEEFCNRRFQPLTERILPTHGLMPPLLQAMVKEQKMAKKEAIPEQPKMKMVYAVSPFRRNRMANDNEVPNVQFEKHVSLHLYEDVLEKSNK